MKSHLAPTWSHLKPHLQRLERAELLALLRELYALNADNKVFLSTRLLSGTPDEIAEPYRQIIRQVFNPDRGLPSLRLSVARKALNDFKKASRDPLLTIDLMLFYVEQGVICTNTYGDINESFYRSLVSAYHSAAQLAMEIKDPDLVDALQPRFQEIVGDTQNMGWGFHEALIDVYTGVLPTYWDL